MININVNNEREFILPYEENMTIGSIKDILKIQLKEDISKIMLGEFEHLDKFSIGQYKITPSSNLKVLTLKENITFIKETDTKRFYRCRTCRSFRMSFDINTSHNKVTTPHDRNCKEKETKPKDDIFNIFGQSFRDESTQDLNILSNILDQSDTLNVIDPERISKLVKEEIQTLKFIYKSTFLNFNDTEIDEYLENKQSYVFYFNNELTAGITYNLVNIDTVSFLFIGLIGVKFEYSRMGIGSKLLNYIKDNICNKIVLYGDSGKIQEKFFVKNGFRNAKMLGYALQKVIPVFNFATFKQFGFEKGEIKFLIQWGKLQNKDKRQKNE